MTEWRAVTFRGQEVNVCEARIKKESRDPDLYYYEIRHSDSDWGNPVTIEEAVVVNFFGILISKLPLQLGPNSCIRLNKAEQQLFSY